MSTPLILPVLGSDAETEGQIISLVECGADVRKGDTVMEVETDKVVLEIPAAADGTIASLAVKIGDRVRSGMVFGSLRTVDAAPAAVSAEAGAPAPAPAPAPETTALRQPAQHSPGESAAPVAASASPPQSPPTAPAQGVAAVAAGPAARRMARTLGIDIAAVRGTGSRERVTRDDVIVHAKRIITQAGPTAAEPRRAARELPDPALHGPVRREATSGIARATARNMQFAWSEIPHAWVQEEVDITALEALRQRVKRAARGELPLTVTAILCRVVALALGRFPVFNSVLDSTTEELVYRDYVNIGVAVDTPRGLVVPCLRAVEGKSALQIGEELKAIGARAVAGKLTGEDFRGSGFTISNLGGIGVSGMFPLVNWPEVAILGVASSRERCVLADGSVSNRLIMPLTLGFDHRVVNGADAARFLGFIRECIEEPGMLLIHT